MALKHFAKFGYCKAEWSAGMMAIAAPLVTPAGSVFVVNMSFPCTEGDVPTLLGRHADTLRQLVVDIDHAWRTERRVVPPS